MKRVFILWKMSKPIICKHWEIKRSQDGFVRSWLYLTEVRFFSVARVWKGVVFFWKNVSSLEHTGPKTVANSSVSSGRWWGGWSDGAGDVGGEVERTGFVQPYGEEFGREVSYGTLQLTYWERLGKTEPHFSWRHKANSQGAMVESCKKKKKGNSSDA